MAKDKVKHESSLDQLNCIKSYSQKLTDIKKAILKAIDELKNKIAKDLFDGEQ